MREAEKNLNDLNKCCGLFTCPWMKDGVEKGDEYKKVFKGTDDGPISAQPTRVCDDRSGGAMMSGNYIHKSVLALFCLCTVENCLFIWSELKTTKIANWSHSFTKIRKFLRSD